MGQGGSQGRRRRIVGSGHIRDVVREVCGVVDGVHEIPPGVDVELWRPAPREQALGGCSRNRGSIARTRATPRSGSPTSGNAERLAAFLAGDRPTVVYFGKLIENKGVQVLLEALTRRRRPRGDRRLRRLPGRARGAGRGLDALFTGPLEHRHLVHLLALADAAVVPSIFPEAFGMVAAEAAATGCPPIVADHSGLAEIARGLDEVYPSALVGASRASQR